MRAEVLWISILAHFSVLSTKLTGQLLPLYSKSGVDPLLSAKVILDGVPYQIIDSQGVFTLYNLTEGSHSLELFATHQTFASLSLEVRKEFVVVQITYENRKALVESEDVLEIPSTEEVSYYESRSQTSLLRLLANPMTFMLVIAGVVTCFAPKQMMDREQMQELKRLQKEMDQEKGKDWVDSLLRLVDPED